MHASGVSLGMPSGLAQSLFMFLCFWGMIARGSWVLRPLGSAHDSVMFLSLSLWGMIARGSWVLRPLGSAHDLVMFLSPSLPLLCPDCLGVLGPLTLGFCPCPSLPPL